MLDIEIILQEDIGLPASFQKKCGPTCIQMVINYFGQSFEKQDKIIKEIDTEGIRGRTVGIAGYLSGRGFFATAVKVSEFKVFEFIEFVEENNCPAILCHSSSSVNHGGHHTVLRGFSDKRNLIALKNDPAKNNEVKIKLEILKELWRDKNNGQVTGFWAVIVSTDECKVSLLEKLGLIESKI